MLKLLRRSATFRSQCERIAAATNVHVGVRLVASLGGSALARATIRRFSTGVIIADIQIAALSDFEEMFAHEFEHIIEQIEGLDLRALARSDPDRVVEVGDGIFETTRAIKAGQIVVLEVVTRPRG